MGDLFFLIPFSKRTFAGSPRGFLTEVTATDAAAIVVSLIAQSADLQSMLKFRGFDLLQAVGHMSGQ
jgi:hypothetical protein